MVDGRKYPKLVFVRWIGHSVSGKLHLNIISWCLYFTNCPRLTFHFNIVAVNKAKACVQAVSVARLLGDTHLEISASDKLEVDEATVLKRLVA